MLGQRAARLLDAPTRPVVPQRINLDAARLTTQERLGRWRALSLKVFLILQNVQLKRTSQEILGRDAYRRIFQQLDGMLYPTAPVVMHRVINGQVMGKQLPLREEESSDMQAMCQHPFDQIKTRGNQKAKWFTCLRCSARWERKALPEQTGPAQSTDLITFGEKMIGKTYEEAFEDTEYVRWVLTTAESGEAQAYPGLIRLARFFAEAEAEVALQEEDLMEDA